MSKNIIEENVIDDSVYPRKSKRKGESKENYGQASKRIDELWQQYKNSEHVKSGEAYNYNTFRKELESRQIRQQLQDNAGLSAGNTDDNGKPASVQSAGNNNDQMEPMDVMDNNAGPNLGNSSGSQMGAPGATNVHSSTIWLSRGGGNSTTSKLTFRKKRVFYSNGFAFQQIDVDSTPQDYPHSGISTPLDNLFVDFLPSYLNFTEFNTLPNGATATQARCRVKVLKYWAQEHHLKLAEH